MNILLQNKSLEELAQAYFTDEAAQINFVYDPIYKTDTIIVRNQQEHLAFQAAIQSLMQALPALQDTPPAIEYFLYALIPDLKSAAKTPTLLQDLDTSDVLVKQVKNNTGQLRETLSTSYLPSSLSSVNGQNTAGEPAGVAQFRDEPLQ